jgi:uncharacterized protein (TIGR00266 family)
VQIDITSRPAYAVAYVRLSRGEVVLAESGALVSMSAGVEAAATLSGGLVQSVARRLIANESLVMARYVAHVEGGWVALAPRFPGDVVSFELTPSTPLYVQAGSLLAHAETVDVGPSAGNVQTVALREGAIVLSATGHGALLLAGYGGMERFDLNAGETLVVDSGHLAAWSASLGFRVGPLKGFVSSALTGEGIVAEFTGPGTVLVQTRAEQQLRSWLLPGRAHDEKH